MACGAVSRRTWPYEVRVFVADLQGRTPWKAALLGTYRGIPLGKPSRPVSYCKDALPVARHEQLRSTGTPYQTIGRWDGRSWCVYLLDPMKLAASHQYSVVGRVVVRAPLGALPLLGLCGSMAFGQLLKLSRGGFRTLWTPEWLMQRGLGLLSDPTMPL